MTLYEHLLSRGLDPKRYQCVVDEEEYVATFFLFNLSGQITGYQRYNPRAEGKKVNDPKLGRYFTYTPRGVDAILGLETNRGAAGTPLFVVEGLFKQAAIINAGFDCIATLTSDPKRFRPLFRILKETRPLYAVGDADPAGGKLVSRVKAGAQSLRDLDEMPTEYVRELCTSLIG